MDLKIAASNSVDPRPYFEDTTRFKGTPSFPMIQEVDEYKAKYEASLAATPEPEPDWLDTVVAKANLMPDTDHTLAEAMQTALRLGSPLDYKVLESEREDLAKQLSSEDLEKKKNHEKDAYLTRAHRVFTYGELKGLARRRADLPEDLMEMEKFDARKVGSGFRAVVVLKSYNPAPWENLRKQLSHSVSPQHSQSQDMQHEQGLGVER